MHCGRKDEIIEGCVCVCVTLCVCVRREDQVEIQKMC